MKIATFSRKDSDVSRVGVLTDTDHIVDVTEAAASRGDHRLATMLTFLRYGRAGVSLARELAEAGAATYALQDVRLHAPIVQPGKILAVGLNYEDHRAEAAGARPRSPYPEGFVKLSSTVIGPDETIALWPDVKQLDYEAELAVVIGRTAHNVSKQEALGYVAGYTVANDVSARDWQTSEQSRARSPLMGKNFPTFCPLGPWLTLRDEIPDPQALRVELRVNGETRQSGSTKQMIFTVSEIVAHWSKLRLDPGDVILTGTPAGVAFGRKPDPAPFWLKTGDVVEVDIERIGVLRNRVGPTCDC